ncbi:MAG: hypothetical protein GXP55_17625 [Deltaproteobacteria bacterium]|nr:hypothetical protein [Deltaproteobacteria bacterium]
MMRTSIHSTMVFAALLLGACSASNPAPTRPCSIPSDCALSETCVDGACVARPPGDSGVDSGGGFDATLPDGGRRTLVSIAITPDAPSLVARDGASASVDLDIEASFDDGSTENIPTGFWSAPASVVGDVDSTSGVFTAAGSVAGDVEVTVEALGMTATTTVHVEIEAVILAPGAPADAADRFSPAPVIDASRRVDLLYPLEGTVFPGNVAAADIQWDGGASGDLYRLRMVLPAVRITAYLAWDGDDHYAVPASAWRALAESAPETSITLTVDRFEASSGEVIAGSPRSFRFADATIRGAIYYWDLSEGRIQRIRGDGTGREDFMPTPPARPSDGRRCVACHTISRDGRKMAAELWDGGDYGAIFDLTADLSVDPAPTLVPPSVQKFLGATFSPDTTRLVASYGNELFLMDGDTGARMSAGGAGLPTAGAAHPTWSPDGSSVAYASGTNGSWAVDFTRADLSLIPVSGPDAFGPSSMIFPGAGLAVAHPSWSPDSAFLAFQHGEHSRAREDRGPGATPRTIARDATLKMVSRDGSTTYLLERLNAGATQSYYPTFSPFDEGGYFWLAFFSTRDYGNSRAGTAGSGRRQLWVAAVSDSPTAGSDPSFAPYWLPQQDRTTDNMAAQWTEAPCRADARGCATSGECCSGFCRDEGAGPVCVPPDRVSCSEEGEACRADSDCCDAAAACVSNRCGTLG